ncbi:hypothetical protein ACMZ29_04060 [Brevibacterium casei]|uniref:Uncharacterized protein n=1 Tax=Brevibacterium casei TaxID=33889 RepID=A0AB34XVG4_9MICO|nr:hypothetical protein [Brevibacterium casei]KZE23427.1 hypothetical protein AVW13_04245 [Brevibacterium casei]MDH5149324.1 hypothetical protein [Brevibacterium casei]QQT70531.1 hypothetical protein I6I57_06575 [Brevibacterium casei]
MSARGSESHSDGPGEPDAAESSAHDSPRTGPSSESPAAESLSPTDSPTTSAATNEPSETRRRATAADDREKQERLERALRRYRATLRNEAESDASGFSPEHYRSQKPPHW